MEVGNGTPKNIEEALKEIKALRSYRVKYRQSHWIFWWLVGIIFFTLASFYYDGWRQFILISAAILFLVLTVLMLKGKLNLSIPKIPDTLDMESPVAERIAFLKGYIKSVQQNKK